MANIFARYENMDPYILLSAVNLKLRNEDLDLAELCSTYEMDEHKLTKRLKSVGYSYDKEQKQFR